jgi:signal transduction histidine kinase
MNKRKIKSSSIVYKLNSKLLVRLLLLFLILDVTVFFVFTVQSVMHTEKELASITEAIRESDNLSEDDFQWLKIAGINISVHPEKKDGFLQKEKNRSFELPKSKNGTLIERFDNLIYNYEFSLDGTVYKISFALGDRVLELKRILVVLFIVELILLIFSILPGAKMIRNTLRPISILTEAAQSINVGDKSFSTKEVDNLADALYSINASVLDTRIPLDETEAELKNLAEAINSLLDRINESYKAQIRFVSDASHELRTPISVIEGYANLLDRWGKNDEKTLDEGIKAIKGEASNMKGLVEQLLFLARGDNRTMGLQRENFNLGQLADEVFKESLMIDDGHEYDFNVEDVEICADKSLIKQALRILVDNAIKYSNPGGKINLFVSPKEDNAVLTVQDEGVGIPPEDVSKIFDRFYRADQSRARSTGGSGLGLSIAKWIVERHGGHMEVLSRQGIGTRVTIYLPGEHPPIDA